MKKLITLITTLTASITAFAQDEPKVKFSGYLETYYGYDFNKPSDHNRPGFIYSHNRANEVNLNLGFIKAAYDNGNIRANVALMAGTYTNANLAAEPGVLKNIFEANAGVKLSKSQNLWIDAGIFSSHIGFESAISKDCWVLTRNIASENTPYYESGAKVTYSTNDGKLTATLLYLNGWQRITRQNGNDKPAGGLQLTWKPSAKITVNYSNYLGSEGADSVRVNRFYHNIYGIFQVTDKFGLTLGVDYGTQQKSKEGNLKNKVFSPVAIAQYKFAEKWAVAGRFEYYEDKNGVFIATGTPNGFKTKGYSLNVDYAPIPNAVIRLEGKTYDSRDKIFTRANSTVNASTTLTAGIAVAF
ncbi:porin [Pedobacter sp. Leaf194]|uniref:porin n=1 Tax=Pedobacter sp. Leaf194 TaxID=1736297 RepID=UPI0007034FC3|nr:porin [Pedobacter sp. Leaf194]KQS36339.1 hypothetical protein ASG14_13050 [Pedobacter sp. Leaf194]RYD77957.1 MAG: porin [Sphingobacteriales bacterium]